MPNTTSTPHTITARVSVAPAINILNTIMMLSLTEVRSGLSDFVVQTANNFTPEQKRDNAVATYLLDIGMEHALNAPSFEAYLTTLETVDFAAGIHKILRGLCTDEAPIHTPEALLASRELFVQVISERHMHKGEDIDPIILYRVHELMEDPEEARRFVIGHLLLLYHHVVSDGWHRHLPTIEAAVRAFDNVDLTDLTPLEAVQAVTGRDMTGFVEDTEDIDEIVFVPSVHCGPYVSRDQIDRTLVLVFGARPPEGVQNASVELSLRDVLLQLSALADDTRLHILVLLTRNNELCNADFQQMLSLSQSSVSRHLRQLVATGFLNERRRDLNKYYSLNTRRVYETNAALQMLLTRRG
jgi:ArsR family transcriptional regulator